MIVVSILATGTYVGYESITRLSDPPEIDYIWVVAAAAIIGFIGNEADDGSDRYHPDVVDLRRVAQPCDGLIADVDAGGQDGHHDQQPSQVLSLPVGIIEAFVWPTSWTT